MVNPWQKIKLEDYENHMSLPDIKQAQYLSNHLKEVVKMFNPNSLAIIGCAGGNGLEKMNHKTIEKIICVDINPVFLNKAIERYKKSFKNIEFICCDIASEEFKFKPVDLIYAGLVFEYVDYNLALNNVSRFIRPNGKLAAVLQMPNENIPEVSPSPYKSLEILSETFSFVQVDKFIDECKKYGFDLISENKTKLKSGKKFCEPILQKVM